MNARRTGIIPAHAGKSGGCFFYRYGGWDHPRSCGEKRDIMSRYGNLKGSSPLMRGKAGTVVIEPRLAGIIPAHAGKSHTA